MELFRSFVRSTALTAAPQSRLSLKSVWIWPDSVLLSVFAAGPVSPGNNESAGKKKSVRISRAGVYLKPALVQAVHAAVNDKTNPYYVLKYERIVKHRGKKRAIIAIVRMILTAIFSILSIGQIGTLLTCSILMCLSTSWSNNVLKLSNRPFVSFNHKGLRLVSFLSTPNFLPQKIFAFRGRGLRPPEVRFLSENLSH